MSGTAREIAAAVRSGARSARSVVSRSTWPRSTPREAEIHACNVVLRDEALAAADAVDAAVGRGEDPGPLAGVPVALKDNLCTRGIPTTCSSKILDGWRPPYTATVVQHARRRRRRSRSPRPTSTSSRWARRPRTRRSASPATRTTSPGRRRVERWIGGRGRRRVRAARARLRHRRLDPPARGAVRRGGREAHVRAREPLRADRVRVEPRPDRSVRDDGRRRRAAARDDLGPRPHGLDVDRRRARAARRWAPTSPGCGSGVVSELTDVDGIDPQVRAAVEQAAGALEAAGATVDRVSVPSCTYGLSAYYLIAPAEASSNLGALRRRAVRPAGRRRGRRRHERADTRRGLRRPR